MAKYDEVNETTPPTGGSAVNKPIKELTVKLTLDTTEFKSSIEELSKILEEKGKEITRSLSISMAEAFKKLGNDLGNSIYGVDLGSEKDKAHKGFVNGYDGYSIDVRTMDEVPLKVTKVKACKDCAWCVDGISGDPVCGKLHYKILDPDKIRTDCPYKANKG